MQLFHDRYTAGCMLAEELRPTVGADPFTLVIGLAPGGVLIGSALAEHLRADLDVLLVQELELPHRPGLSVGVMVSGGSTILNEAAMQYLQVSDFLLDRMVMQAGTELSHREKSYRDGRPPLPVRGRTVILADDGSASGPALLAAAKALKSQGLKKLVVACPMADKALVRELAQQTDKVVCIALPQSVGSPAVWYENFEPVTGEDVKRVLEESAHETKSAAAGTY